MRENTLQIQEQSSHQSSPEYTHAFTMDEIQYLSEMPPPTRFPRPPPASNRYIRHAAAIFDPSFAPTPTQYKLPPRCRRYYGDLGPELRNGKTHQRKDSGYESGAYALTAEDEDIDDGIDAWCDAVLAHAPTAEASARILRAEAVCFRPGVRESCDVGDGMVGVGDARQEFDGDGEGGGVLGAGGRMGRCLSGIEGSEDEGDANRQGGFTDDEGCALRLGCGSRSDGAREDVDEGNYDEGFEEGSRARWSV